MRKRRFLFFRWNKKTFKSIFISKQIKTLSLMYLAITGAILLHAYILYYFDVIKGGQSATLFDYIWCGYTTASTTGYGDISAVSTPARITTIILMYHVVIGLFTWFISTVIDSMLMLKERRLKGMLESNQQNGLVIFSYPGLEQTLTLIKEFRNEIPELPVCIVDPDLEDLPITLHSLGGVHFIRKRLLSNETYKAANVKEARWIFIFPTDHDDSDSDALTITIYQKLIQEEFNCDSTRIIPLVIGKESHELLNSMNSPAIMSDVHVKLMVQEATDVHVGKAIDSLLMSTEGASPVTVKPNAYIGKKWTDLEGAISQHNTSKTEEEGINLLSIIKSGIPKWTFSDQTIIEDKDHILIACFPGKSSSFEF